MTVRNPEPSRYRSGVIQDLIAWALTIGTILFVCEAFLRATIG